MKTRRMATFILCSTRSNRSTENARKSLDGFLNLCALSILVEPGGTSRNAKTCLEQVTQLAGSVGNQGEFGLNYVKMR